jgi:hypothetical protein
MFYEDIVFNNGGSPSINNWNTSKVTTIDNTFLVLALINHLIIGMFLVTLATTINFMEENI